MESSLLRHILICSGVTVSNCPEQFENLQKMLQSVFLTPQHCKWFEERQNEHIKRLSEYLMPITMNTENSKDNWLYWELFTFGKLNALCNESAIQAFNKLNVKECYLLQIPTYNTNSDIKPTYSLKGEYDVSNVNDPDDFEALKDLIKTGTSIPYWVIDNIAQQIGKEIYVFDTSMAWVLVLTHENEVFLYEAK